MEKLAQLNTFLLRPAQQNIVTRRNFEIDRLVHTDKAEALATRRDLAPKRNGLSVNILKSMRPTLLFQPQNRMKRLLVAAVVTYGVLAFTASIAVAQQTRVPVGLYAGGVGSPPQPANPYPGFDAQWDSFVSVIGTNPQYFTSYSDQCYAPDDPYSTQYGWPSQASYQASLAASDSRTKNLIPITTIPFFYDSTCGGGHPNIGVVDETSNIANGVFDAQITGQLDAWKAYGYTTIFIRPSWEFNVSVAWGQLTAADMSTWIAAFQHFYTVAHNYAQQIGVTINIVWCPDIGNNQNPGSSYLTVNDWYPGDAYVDDLGIDTYGAPVDGSHDNVSATTSDATQYLVSTMFAMAAAKNKHVVFGEVGGGPSDTAFPSSMVAALNDPAIRQGVIIDAFAFFDINDGGDGNLSFTLPSDNATTNADTWAAGFGPSGSVVNGTPTCSTNMQVTPGVPLADAGGNSFIIDNNGQVDYNGVPIWYTANVIYLARVNNVVWQFGTGQWYSFGPPDSNGVPTTTYIPYPTLPNGAPANQEVGPGIALADAFGNSYIIDGNAQVDFNGVPIWYTANVTYLASLNGEIWQFGTGQWYSFGPANSSGLPTTTSGPISTLPSICSN